MTADVHAQDHRLSHTAEGWWLEQRGPVAPRPALAGEAAADFVVIGGGFTGLWSAWCLAEREPAARIALLEAGVCGHGPSGRNAGFVNSYWYSMGNLRERYGATAALAVAHAGERALGEVGEWCAENQVDFRRAGHLVVSTAAGFDGAWRDSVSACAELGAGEKYGELDAAEVRLRCASPVFRAGAFMPAAATVDPARLALGLRERLIERGVTIHEHSRVRCLDDRRTGVVVETSGGRLRAGAAVLAVNAASAGVAPLRRRLTVASSHIVLTEPVPDVLEEVGWTAGEAITDARAYLHYFRTTADHRILFGWAGGEVGYGARLGGRVEIDPRVTRQARRDLVRIFPALARRRVTHAWGGPIDIAPSHLPAFGTLPGGRAHYGFGYTGNGVGPARLGGSILASLALDRRDDLTRLALVEPPSATVPPEPFRYVGGRLIRAAFLRRERALERGARVGPITEFVVDVPRRLGVHVGR